MATKHTKPIVEDSEGAVQPPCQLQLKRLGIDTQEEFFVYLRHDCPVVRSEGFESQTRISVHKDDQSIVATLNIIHSDILQVGEASLSESAWAMLQARNGEILTVSHLPPIESFGFVRGKFYGRRFSKYAFHQIVQDIKAGCGCTVPRWDKAPLAPGESGSIRVVFNSSGKSGSQNIRITVQTNARNPSEQLYLKAIVESKL